VGERGVSRRGEFEILCYTTMTKCWELRGKWVKSVMASITEEIRKGRNGLTNWDDEPNQIDSLESIHPSLIEIEPDQGMSHWRGTQGERNSGTRSVSHVGSAELTGKLCQCVMALIR
jgi:hypothetical protein